MLLIAHNHHHTETHFIFSIFVIISWYSSIMLSIFTFTLIFPTIDHIFSLKQAYLFFCKIFRRSHISFGWLDGRIKGIIFK